jgi:hypothetical protein
MRLRPALTLLALLSFAAAQDQKDMPGMNMNDAASAHAMQAMQGHHMEMGPHMKMTALRPPQPGDAERAAQVVEAARKVAEHYRDYKVALADGFKIFLPNVPQPQYHFTNSRYGFAAAFHFDPARNPRRCSTKKTATDTGWSGSCTPPAKMPAKTI